MIKAKLLIRVLFKCDTSTTEQDDQQISLYSHAQKTFVKMCTYSKSNQKSDNNVTGRLLSLKIINYIKTPVTDYTPRQRFHLVNIKKGYGTGVISQGDPLRGQLAVITSH